MQMLILWSHQAASGKKKKTSHTPFLPTFARQTKQQQKLEANSTASTSATTLDDGEPPVKRRRTAMNLSAFGLAPRESSRKSAVEFKKTIEVRLKESEQRRVSFLRYS